MDSGAAPPGREWNLHRLDTWEMHVVRRQSAVLRQPMFRYAAIVINHLGNGWLYPLFAVILFITQGWAARGVIGPAVLSLTIAHGIYPIIKTYVARPRPIDRDPTMTPRVEPLDVYSCPSGHCMTASATFTPLAFAFPGTILPLCILTLLIGWARLAAAHHYPSDLLLGALLGTAIALPVSWWAAAFRIFLYPAAFGGSQF